MGQRIDESADPVLFGASDLAILSANWINPMSGHFRSQHRRDFVREESGAVYDAACFNFPGGTDDTDPARQNLQLFDPRIRDEVGSAIRGDARISLHKLLARDDSRRRNLDRLNSFDVRFAGANGRPVNQSQPLQTIRAS